MSRSQLESWRTCFVVMPYGKREAERRVVDFNTVYEDVFKPAIGKVQVDGKARLVPKRADDAAHSRVLLFTMNQDLLQSRLVLGDLSIHNTNVGLELGLRFMHVGRGTVLVRLKGTSIPFDFAPIQVTEYSDTPPDAIPAARSIIATALRETLKFYDIDNPYYEKAKELAQRMGTPDKPTKLGNLLVDAQEATKNDDLKTAREKYAEAERLEPLLEGVSKLRWLNPTSQDVAGSDPQKNLRPGRFAEIILCTSQKPDGSFLYDLMVNAKRKSQYEQIVNSVSLFGQVQNMGIVMGVYPEQEFQKFSVQGGELCGFKTSDKILSEIKTKTGIKGVTMDPASFLLDSGFKSRGGIGGGSSTP